MNIIHGIPPKLGPLFAGHDAGAYALPEAVTRPREAARRLMAALDERRAEHRALVGASTDGRQRLVTSHVEAALDGRPLDADVEAIVDAKRRADALSLVIDALARAAASVTGRLETAVFDPEIVEFLDDAFQDTLGEVRRLAPALDGIDPDNPDAVLAAERPAAAKAYRQLVALADRLDAIRGAQRVTTGHAADDDTFAVFRDPRAVWGARWTTRRQLPGSAPWPSGRLAYLLWLASDAAAAGQPAILSVEEREDLYRQLVAETQAGQRTARGMAAGGVAMIR